MSASPNDIRIPGDETAVFVAVKDLLSQHPPSGVVVVGAGYGAGCDLWKMCLQGEHGLPVLLIEADADAYSSLVKYSDNERDWHCLSGLVAEQEGSVTFYRANISSENGLLPTDLFQSAWPNITEHFRETMQGNPLPFYMGEDFRSANWLWLNCFFPLEALVGIDRTTSDDCPFQIVCLRLLAGETEDVRTREIALDAVRQKMEGWGFILVAVQPERNPHIVHGLFARSDHPSVATGQTGSNRTLEGQDAGTGILVDNVPAHIGMEIHETLQSSDIPYMVSRMISGSQYGKEELYHYVLGIAKEMHARNDNMYAIGLLNELSFHMDNLPNEYLWNLMQNLIQFGCIDEAYEILIRRMMSAVSLPPDIVGKLQKNHQKWHERILDASGHGHEVLIAHARRHAKLYRKNAGPQKPVLIEIGTTRENASGQGSTRRLMDLCAAESFHFITVDMDSANTEIAAAMFQEHGYPFEAIHGKGEDFLASYSGRMDFVFLDAYDFDHGKHSERRQARYVKFLGSRIDEKKCHIMHLDCAQSVAGKLSKHGVVCVDDTWLDDGIWTAKGTLAMPFLLKSGMILLDVRNKSALLGRPAGARRKNVKH